MRYTTKELRALRRYDVKPARAARKVILGYRLWRPIRQLRGTHRHGMSSRDGPPRAVSIQPSVDNCDARSPTVFGCLNIRSLLNKFDDVVELCGDRHIDLLCLTESWHDADSAVLGRLRCAGFNVVPRGQSEKTDTACCKRLDTRNHFYVHLGTQSIWTTLEIFCSKSLGSPEPT